MMTDRLQARVHRMGLLDDGQSLGEEGVPIRQVPRCLVPGGHCLVDLKNKRL